MTAALISNDTVAELALNSIKVAGRHRKDLGDIKALADSIDSLGLINPVTVTPDCRLVAGERRIAAVRELGWETIPVNVIQTLADAADELMAECHENTERKDFTPTEAAAIRKALTEILAPIAAEEKAAAIKARDEKGRAASTGGSLPPVGKRPKTRDVASKPTGYSGRTLDKVDEVQEIAVHPQTPEPVRDVARKALDEMDKSGNVSGPHKQVIDAKRKAEAPQPDPAVTEIIESDQSIRDAKYLHEWSKALVRSDDFLRFDPERLGRICDEADITSLDHLIKSTTTFLAALKKSRTGLRLV